MGSRQNLDVDGRMTLQRQRQADIRVAALHCLDDMLQAPHIIGDGNAFALLEEAPHCQGRYSVAQRRGGDDAQPSGNSLAHILRPRNKASQKAEHWLDILVQGNGFFRRLEATMKALEERHSRLRFELPDSVGNGRLRDP